MAQDSASTHVPDTPKAAYSFLARINQKVSKAPWWQWSLVTLAIAYGGIKVQDWLRTRAAVQPYAYTQMAFEYPTSSRATRNLIRQSMIKGYVENREFDSHIIEAILRDHPEGFLARSATNSADPGWDERHLAALLAADPTR